MRDLKYYMIKCGLYWLLVTFNKKMEEVDPTGKAQVILEAVMCMYLVIQLK